MNVETILRTEFADRAAGLEVPDDPWPSFARRETRHRRVRRTKVGLAAAAVAALAGLQANILPMPGWAPTYQLAATADALIDGPARGQLAGDHAFLEGIRQRAEGAEDGDGVWEITDRSKIRFLYAGDVGARRLVLAYIPLRWGFVSSPQLYWFSGPAGATADQMEQGGNADATDQTAEFVETAADGPGVAVLVAPLGSTAAINPTYEYGADGRIHYAPAITGAAGSGLAEAVLPPTVGEPAVRMTFTRDGHTTEVPAYGGGTGDLPGNDPAYEAAIAKALGGREFDHEMLISWVQDGLLATNMRIGEARLKVRWTGTVGGQAAALFTLQKPGHGVIAFAWRGADGVSRNDLRLLLPAKNADRRPIAWRLRAANDGNQETDQVVVTAPAPATSVTLTPQGGTAIKIELDASGHGTATLPPSRAATVTSYAADGSAVGSTPVPAFDHDIGGYIGKDPATRVVN